MMHKPIWYAMPASKYIGFGIYSICVALLNLLHVCRQCAEGLSLSPLRLTSRLYISALCLALKPLRWVGRFVHSKAVPASFVMHLLLAILLLTVFSPSLRIKKGKTTVTRFVNPTKQALSMAANSWDHLQHPSPHAHSHLFPQLTRVCTYTHTNTGQTVAYFL